MSDAGLTVDQKRQVVYASLLRYTSEATPLRQRALDRLLLGALLDSSRESPFRIGKIQENLALGTEAPKLRILAIQDTIDRLVRAGKVAHVLVREKHAYYLTPQGDEEIKSLVASSGVLFKRVLDKLLRDTESFLPPAIAAEVFQRFIFESFARFGWNIAKSVIGQLSSEDLGRVSDAATAFRCAIDGIPLTSEQSQSLEARCSGFLSSADPDDQQLKFFLTQGYYFAQLLGVDGTGFSPLTEQAFLGSVFYLDSNVLIPAVLEDDFHSNLFLEIVVLSKRIGIELRVTRATINEVRKVAADRTAQLRQIAAALPDELIQRSNDQFIAAYARARKANKRLSPEEFFAAFDNLPSLIESKWQIVFVDVVEDELVIQQNEAITGHSFEGLRRIINDEAEKTRGWGKGRPVVEHDLAHLVIVTKDRATNSKTWFLTRDRSLLAVAAAIGQGASPFCFAILGFLQSISPFLATAGEERSFADAFSAFLGDQIRPIDAVFEARELALMAEFHEDVMATPPDQLLMAFDYVKSHTLKGKVYKEEDIPRVSLELRKFLASDKQGQIRTLHLERERLALDHAAEVERRLAAEEANRNKQEKIVKLEKEVQDLNALALSTTAEVEAAKGALARQQGIIDDELSRRRVARMVAGFIVGSAVWLMRESVLIPFLVDRRMLPDWADACVRVVGALTFVLPAYLFLRAAKWSANLKTAVLTGIGAVALFGLGFLKEGALSTVADYLGIASFLTVVVLAEVRVRK